MTTEEIKLAVIQLLEAQAKLDDAQQDVTDAEVNLANMFSDEETILSEWNTVGVDGCFYDLKFDIENHEFESLKPNHFKHF